MSTRTTTVVFLLVVALLASLQMKSERRTVVVREPAAAVQPNRIQLYVSAAATRNEQAARACENEVNLILDREFPEIERCANHAAEQVASMSSCTTIIYRLAKEKLGRGSGTTEFVEAQIRGRLQPSLDACGRELTTALDRYELALRESTVTLASDLAQANPPSGVPPLDISVDVRTSGDLDRTLRNLGISGGVLTVAGGFDVAAIINSGVVRSLMRRIATLAASIFAKPAATAAGSAVVMAADGPLPVGDALAVIGGLWTGYEIYSTRRQFEQDIKASLVNALPEMKRNVHHQIMDRVRTLQSDYQRAQYQIRDQMVSSTTHEFP